MSDYYSTNDGHSFKGVYHGVSILDGLKLAEGKNPKLWKEETTTTLEAMRPQQQEDNND